MVTCVPCTPTDTILVQSLDYLSIAKSRNEPSAHQHDKAGVLQQIATACSLMQRQRLNAAFCFVTQQLN
eukprot:6195461-Pleurochrysis_carterae.AAC.4